MASPTNTGRHSGDATLNSTMHTTDDTGALSNGQPADSSTCYRDFAQVDTRTAADNSFWAEQEITICKAPFPVILHNMLSNPRNQDVVAWLPHGRSWKILKKMPFEEKVLPRYFKHGKMASFIRQIHGYGFRRIPTGVDCGSYYHELFLRGMPHLCTKIPRVKANPKGNKHIKKDSEIPNFYQMDRENPLPGNGSLSTKKSEDAVSISVGNETDQPATTTAPANTGSCGYGNSSATLDTSMQSNRYNGSQTSITNQGIQPELAAQTDAPMVNQLNSFLSVSRNTDAANSTSVALNPVINANVNPQYNQILASLVRSVPETLALSSQASLSGQQPLINVSSEQQVSTAPNLTNIALFTLPSINSFQTSPQPSNYQGNQPNINQNPTGAVISLLPTNSLVAINGYPNAPSLQHPLPNAIQGDTNHGALNCLTNLVPTATSNADTTLQSGTNLNAQAISLLTTAINNLVQNQSFDRQNTNAPT